MADQFLKQLEALEQMSAWLNEREASEAALDERGLLRVLIAEVRGLRADLQRQAAVAELRSAA